ncbi:reverse transcriptase domain-containing protein, partial [Tanacetum coccineum]
MIRGGENRKRPFEGERFCLANELTFLAIPRNQLTDEPIILEGVIEGHQTKKMQSSDDGFLKRNVPPSRNNRLSSNYGKGRKEQNGANGVCNNKMSFAIQRHNMKDRNEKPWSVEKLYGNADSWKGCKVCGRRRAPGKHGGICMGWIRKNCRIAIRHGASTKDIPSRRAGGRDDQKGSTPEWDAHTIPVKLANETWKVQVDYSSLNKVCAKDIQIRMAENDKEKTRFHTEEGVYCFTHMPKELKNSAVTLQGIIEKLLSDQRRRNVEVYLKEIVVKSKMDEGSFLGHMVTKEGIRAYPEKVQTIIRSPTPKSPNQIRSLFIQLKAIIKFIPKLAELKYPIREEGEVLMLCLQQRSETISSMLLVEREGIQIHVSYVSRLLQEMEICYTPMEKMVHALIHTTRSLRTIFRKHKVTVVTDRPMEEILKLPGRDEQLAKWDAEAQIYDIS